MLESGEEYFRVIFPLDSINFWKRQPFQYSLTHDELLILVSTEQKAQTLVRGYIEFLIFEYPVHWPEMKVTE